MSLQIEHARCLAPLTTLRVGGPASHFTAVNKKEQLQEAVVYAKHHNLPVKVIAGGSNILASDEGVSGLVIHMSIKGVFYIQKGESIFITAGAGEKLDDVVAHTVSQGWWGLENLSHIPGTVGATPVQNVGAYGVEVKDSIASVHVFDMEEEMFKEFTASQCQFGYRDSIFKKREGKKYIVTAVTYKLSVTPQLRLSYRDLSEYFGSRVPELREIRQAVIEIRSHKFPDWHTVGTAGSFFKNPIVSDAKFKELRVAYPGLPGFVVDEGLIKLPLGWILDKILNIKGVQEGSVGTYEKQALVLINHGGASADMIESFADNIIQKVKDTIGVSVEWEVTKFT